MLDLDDIEALLARFTYKPNVRIEARGQDPWDDRIMVRAVMWTLDSHKPYPDLDPRTMSLVSYGGTVQTVSGTYFFEPVKIARQAVVPETVLKEGEDLFWIWLKRALISQLENHEIDEWFQVDGRPLHDPHESPKPLIDKGK